MPHPRHQPPPQQQLTKDGKKIVSRHFTQQQAHNAASQRLIEARSKALTGSSGHMKLDYQVQQHGIVRRWVVTEE